MSSGIGAKKAFERYLLERFLAAGSFEATSITEREAPDFEVMISGQVVGIEVTQAFATQGGSQETLSAEELMHRVVAKAHRIHVKASSRPAQVRVVFKSAPEVRSMRRDEASLQIADSVRELDLRPFEKADLYEWQDATPQGVHSIHVIGVPEHSMGHWGPAQAGWVEPVSTAQLQAIVEAKSRLVDDYRTKTATVWLAIVVYALRASGLVEVRPDFEPALIQSPFDRTYFYRHPDDHVVLLGAQGQ